MKFRRNNAILVEVPACAGGKEIFMYFRWNIARQRRRLAPAACLLLALFSAPSSAAAAGFHPQVSVEARAGAAAVLVNREVALTLRAPADGLTPMDRAQAIARRLSDIAGPQAIQAVPINRSSIAVETAGGRLILIVTKADARSQNTLLGPLAKRWAASIGSLLAIAPVVLAPMRQPAIIPNGCTRSFLVGGAAPAQGISVQDGARGVAQSSFDPATRELTILGKAPGQDQITITADDGQGSEAQMLLNVTIEDPAAQFDRQASARVTGSPCAPASLVTQAVYNALYRMIRPMPGARIQLLESPAVSQSLASGQSMTIAVPVRASGPGLVPVVAMPQVTITNDDTLLPLSATTLFYSNDPERVTHPQTLFCAPLPGLSRPARLVYHHVNGSGSPLTIEIDIVNRSATDSTLQVIHSEAGPADDPIEAGYRAGKDFLQDLVAANSLVLDIPPASTLTLMAARVPNGQTVSGFFQLAQIGTQPCSLLIKVAAEPADADSPAPLDSLAHPVNSENGAYPVTMPAGDLAASGQFAAMSPEIYEYPNVPLSGSYDVGGRWLYINLGIARDISRKGDRRQTLAGNYGVVYDIDITLKNPTAVPRDVGIEFLAQAGIAAGVFLLDKSQWVCLDPSQGVEEQIERVDLAPGQTRTLDIETMPLAGSAYPVSLIAHELQRSF